MQFWDSIINTAMMGTDKKTTTADDLPAGLATAAAQVLAHDATDKEEKFLQLASLALSYRQCGVIALHKEQVVLTPAPTEEKTYCNSSAATVLKDILEEESISLLKLWLRYCHHSNNIVLPEIVPALLSTGVQQKKLQTLITSCCGKRGEWLARFNDAWNFSANQTTDEQWQTGTPEQRKAVLAETRTANPDLAREWLQQTWPQEDAGTKVSLLEVIDINPGEADIAFLESLKTDKSKKVKDAALALLKKIPGSALVLQYQQLLQQAVTLKKEKALLGLTSKMVLQFQLPATIDDAIFKTGIDKLSSNSKAFTDDEYIIYQLIQSVPLSFWEKQLDSNPQDIIALFQKDAVGKKMIPAFIIAIDKFKDHRWAIAFMQHSEVFYIDIIPLLPVQQQEFYSNRFFATHADSIISYASNRQEEWGYDLALNIVKHAAKNPYQYSRSFLGQHIHLIPDKIALQLEKCTPAEDHLRTMWSNTSDYILKLLQMKAQIIQSFN